MLIFLSQLIPIFFWSIKWDVTAKETQAIRQKPSTQGTGRSIMPEMRLNRKRSVKDGTPNWYEVMVAELGSCQDVFFSKKKLPSKQKKNLSQLACPPRIFVGWCTIVSCWFLLLNPAKGTVGMSFFGFAVSMKQLTNSLIVGSVRYFTCIPGMGIGSF